MTVVLSASLIRAMGFRPLATGESLTASFASICVYEVRGITLPNGATQVTSGSIAGASYRVAVGAGLNEACTALRNDNWVDSEDEWRKEKGCSGPFMLIELGPTQAYTIATGHVKTEEDGSVTTFDSFPEVRQDLAELEAVASPPILSALSCLLGAPDRQVELRRCDRAAPGYTDAGTVLHDIRINVSGTAYVSLGMSSSDLAKDLVAATSLAPRLNARAARFFALGLGEDDELKKFLYFFLALEVETHAVFKRIDHVHALKQLLASAPQVQSATVALLQRQTDSLRSLLDRFVWCAACVWPGIDDTDVEQFKKLKEARDDIAHGSASEPPDGYARLAQQLARKILRS